ncbi:hypothetical protein AAFF_G00116430 [Aldrovandia affinis]|uniref:Uncharacterized protein n=1 Tax=Aldrovandia affinis TaxID=143900 RepID=A0AAD7WXC7_9TELE|nr:hypothetical protein AAFF_G00116430 [Aldrovandia affinis]
MTPCIDYVKPREPPPCQPTLMMVSSSLPPLTLHLLRCLMVKKYRVSQYNNQAESAGMKQNETDVYNVHMKGQDFNTEELVWVYEPKQVKCLSLKLDSNWTGLCYVLECVRGVVYHMRLAPCCRKVVIH